MPLSPDYELLCEIQVPTLIIELVAARSTLMLLKQGQTVKGTLSSWHLLVVMGTALKVNTIIVLVH